VVLLVCGWLLGAFLSLAAAAYTWFLVPSVVGMVLTVLLPLYILDRVRLHRAAG
jgi:hypothetical protein